MLDITKSYSLDSGNQKELEMSDVIFNFLQANFFLFNRLLSHKSRKKFHIFSNSFLQIGVIFHPCPRVSSFSEESMKLERSRNFLPTTWNEIVANARLEIAYFSVSDPSESSLPSIVRN